MKGRKPKPTEHHKAAGTYQPVRHAKRLSVPVSPDIPAPPSGFDKRHVERWYEVCGLLKDAGILAEQDREAVRMYVELSMSAEHAYGVYTQTRERSDFMTYRDAAMAVIRLQDQFGFNPTSRMRMRVEKPNEKPDDPFLELLKLNTQPIQPDA